MGVRIMSFTIKCDKCGSENIFTSNSKKYEGNIGVDVYTRGSYMGESVESIEIECLNLTCDNTIEIKY